MKKSGYVVYTKPYQLNIVSVRSKSTTPNKFDDELYAFWKNEKGEWDGKHFNVTTDPGTFWLKNPMHPEGTAILKQGQYVDAYEIGSHRGLYTALTQAKPVTVIRDYDRNAILDFDNGKEMTGDFGINIHRANKTGTTLTIDKNSAGCIVFENADDFATFMKLCQRQKALYGNRFTFTLFDERAYLRGLRRRGVYVALAFTVAAALWIGIRAYSNKPIIPKL